MTSNEGAASEITKKPLGDTVNSNDEMETQRTQSTGTMFPSESDLPSLRMSTPAEYTSGRSGDFGVLSPCGDGVAIGTTSRQVLDDLGPASAMSSTSSGRTDFEVLPKPESSSKEE